MKKPQQSLAYAFVIGIDVSKDCLDVCLIRCQDGQYFHHQVVNSTAGFRKLKAWVKFLGCELNTDTLLCLEHTGLYTRQLVHYLLSRQVNVWLETPLQIKRSIGLARGKEDKIDATRIAQYALRYQEKAVLLSLEGLTLDKLKDLQANRTRLLKALHSLEVTLQEVKAVDAQSGQLLEQVNQQAVKGLHKSLELVEEKMAQLISEDQELNRKYDLLTTIKGVGKVLAISLLVYTQAFTKLDNARKLACYCGVAPFQYRSGSSIRGKTGVSKLANQDLKRVLHMAAFSSVYHNPELREYYQRKVAQGKNKMSVLNAVRNKLLHRIIAVIKRGTPYELKLNKI